MARFMMEFDAVDAVKSEARMGSEDMVEIAEALQSIKHGGNVAFRLFVEERVERRKMAARIKRLAREKVGVDVTVRVTDRGVNVWLETPEEAEVRKARAASLQEGRKPSPSSQRPRR